MQRKAWQIWWLAGFVLAIFLFLRLHNIQDGFFFFNDMGRDLVELQEWRDTGKPPLLGPQNSSLPFNQPGLYFYWLMPFFVLSNYSVWSTLLALLFTMVLCFIAVQYILRKNHEWLWIALGFSWLVATNPAHVQQNRFVWNPSFVTPLFALAAGALVMLRDSWTLRKVQVFAISLSAAIAFSYSAAPAALIIAIAIAWWWRKEWRKILWLWGSVVVWSLFFQLPTLVFELRYNFQLTKAVLNSPPMEHEGLQLSLKLQNLLDFLLGVHGWGQYVLVIAFVGAVITNLYWIRKRKSNSTRDKAFLHFFPLFLGSVLLTLLAPVPLHAHYIFGIAVLAFFVIVTLQPRITVALLALFTVIWFQPEILSPYFAPARRNVQELFACTKQVCEQETEPMFVSVQSSLHPYHNGPEFRYALRESGCNVQAIERAPAAAQIMAVVEDNGEYQHGLTAYHELSLFGQSTVARSYQCEGNLEIFILEKSQEIPANSL